MGDLHLVVLAAGKGTRMKSALPKVVHRVGGLPMIEHVLRTAQPLQPASTTVVVGHRAECVRAALGHRSAVHFVVQKPQLGTAHALLQAEPALAGARGTVVLLSGDVPLLKTSSLRRLLQAHDESRPALTLLTAQMKRPVGYGRVVRRQGRVQRIVEERDATAAERRIGEINSGIYAFDVRPLFAALRAIEPRNIQGEYYLTDLVSLYRRQRRRVEAVMLESADEIRGINSRTELADVNTVIRQSKNEALMAAGVTLEDPATTYIGPDVTIGPDTVIHPCVFLEGKTQIGAACEIHAGARLVDAVLEDRVTVNNHCVITRSRIRAGATVGPFAHLRPESDVGENARIGNFVELKKTVLGAGSKANHLTYLGDADVGSNVNVGAGTITCNYDGERKHQTVIEDGVFVGSDTQLVAPVTVGRGAYIAAGSSITEDVPPGALGIARGRQVNVEGWVERRKKKD